jgi:hypothetical protein
VIDIDDCLWRIMDIPGACRVTLVDAASGLAVAAAGRHDDIDEHTDAAATTDVVRAVLECPALAVHGAQPDDGGPREIVVCRPQRYHLLALLGGELDATLFVHAVFDEAGGNLAMARYRLRGILDEWRAASQERA